MKTCIIYSTNNKDINLITPVLGIELDLVIEKCVPKGANYKIVNENIFDVDSTFFAAYEFDEELGAKINIEKAKEIQKNKFRQARKPILENLDIEYIKVLETGDIQKQQEIITKKQALRDVTNISLPNDLQGIKNTWPNILEKSPSLE